MARPKNKKIFKEKISYKDYLSLMDFLDQKIEKIKLKKNRTVKLELNKIQNIKGILTLLTHTGMRIGETQQITIKQIKDGILENRFSIVQSKVSRARKVIISKTGVEDFKKVFDCYIDEYDYNNYVIRKLNQPKEYFNKTYLQNITNNMIKEVMGEMYSTHGFRRNLIIEMIDRAGTKDAQLMIGHKSILTTHMYDDDITNEEAQRLLDAIWRDASK